MSQPAHDKNKHPKLDFQVERLAFFSDAVFAIAITLLVIEFKVPHITKETTYDEVWHELADLKYKFLALLLSFFLIANYWVRHHLLFKHINNYNRPILMCNLFMLLPVIFFPFSTAFFYESQTNPAVFPLGCQLFLLNNSIASLLLYILYWMVTKKYPHLSYPMEEKEKQVFTFRVLWMTISMILMLLLSFISFEVTIYGLAPLFVVNMYKQFFKKKTTVTTHVK
ncbi:MAG: TMEM175 family protein [Sediminibacterium sp.]